MVRIIVASPMARRRNHERPCREKRASGLSERVLLIVNLPDRVMIVIWGGAAIFDEVFWVS